MDRIHFLHLDDCLKVAISNGSNLGESDDIRSEMEKISVRACLIYAMRSVAYRKEFYQPFRDERDCYFAGIELMLQEIYSGFFDVPFEKRIKMYYSSPFTPKTNKEMLQVIQKIKEFVPKLKTSWVEKAWMKN